jgi:cytochrome c2
MYAPDVAAQHPDWDYGKVIEVDVVSGKSQTYTLGHRNPQGITLDAAGQLWVVEHGPRGGDELNRIERGANYGWPRETLGTMYSGLPVPNTVSYGRHDSYTAPIYAWLPSVAVSSLTLIHGFHEAWNGDLLVGSLAGQSLYRLRLRGNGVQLAERIDVKRRVRSVLQHTDGRLVLWTDLHEVIFLTPVKSGRVRRFLEERMMIIAPELAPTLKQTIDYCVECHSFSPGINTKAPNLASVLERPIASTSYVGYSEALRSAGGNWTRRRLTAFLKSPQTFAPGTSMPSPGLDNPGVLSSLVDLLAATKQAPLE